MAEPQVAHTVVEIVVALADRNGVELDGLCDGLPLTSRTLRRRLGGLEWSLFVELIHRLEGRLGKERLFSSTSGALPDLSLIGKRILARFVQPQGLLRFVCKVMGPAMYPMYAATYVEEERPDGALEAHLTLKLEDGLPGSRTVFELNGVATAAVPRFIDQAPFPLRAEARERGGDFWFQLRPPKGYSPAG